MRSAAEDILIVDDNREDVKLLANLLKEAGYKIRATGKPEVGLASALDEPPDLILLDVRMPGMDGFELCGHLKRNTRTASVPVIFISAVKEAATRIRGFEAGGVDYITKPFQAREILARVGVHIQLAFTQRDLTQRTAELEDSERKLREHAMVFRYAQEAILIADSQRLIQEVNTAFTEITGYPAREAIGQRPRLLRSGRHDERFYDRLYETLASEGKWQGEIWNRRKDGDIFPAWETITAVQDDKGRISRYISIFSDISERKLTEERFRHLAHYDALTDLPNRLLFNDRCAHALDRARHHGYQMAMLLLDLDRFKPVNDNFGHAVGDVLLQSFARRLKSLVCSEDTIARLGGDEFTVILEKIAQPEDAEGVAKKIIASFQQPFEVQGHILNIGTSIGISLFPQDGNDETTLLKKADEAMYRAKKQGSNRYRFSE